jgi:DNA-binding XRE family transcriptional regulator
MLGVTKKRHTKNYREVRYIGPHEKIERIVNFAKSLDLEDISETIDWRELFPEYKNASSHCIALKGSRKKENLTQKDLARLAGIPQGHISEMENGKRAIGKEIAVKLGKALNVNYKIFL